MVSRCQDKELDKEGYGVVDAVIAAGILETDWFPPVLLFNYLR
jgi:hypothetical protein